MIQYTFLVGAPGSRWSGIGQTIAKTFNYNTSDENQTRVYTHGNFSGHKGAYWGPGMELGNNFHRTSTLKVQDFLNECDRAFEDNKKPMMIKCHQFAHNLDWLHQIPNSNILLVRRTNEQCFEWWKQAGGWNITYPKYDWYKDDANMKLQIELENTNADMFVKKHSKWYDYDKSWITENFGQHNITIDSKFSDIQISLIKSMVF